MPKFTVRLKETVTYDVEVEAETGDEAQQMAAEIWAQSEDPFNDFCGQGQGVEPAYWEPIGDPETGLVADAEGRPMCPACGCLSGDDWSQCADHTCPVVQSPHYGEPPVKRELEPDTNEIPY